MAEIIEQELVLQGKNTAGEIVALYPKTKAAQVIESDDRQFVTLAEKNKIDDITAAYVFDTEEDLGEWLETPANKAKLNVGDNFYIKDPDAPDFWWDGTAAVESKDSKVDLSGYYDSGEVDGLLGGKLDKSALSGAVDSASATTAANSAAVKTAYDLASAANTTAQAAAAKPGVYIGGTLPSAMETGDIWFNTTNIAFTE